MCTVWMWDVYVWVSFMSLFFFNIIPTISFHDPTVLSHPHPRLYHFVLTLGVDSTAPVYSQNLSIHCHLASAGRQIRPTLAVVECISLSNFAHSLDKNIRSGFGFVHHSQGNFCQWGRTAWGLLVSPLSEASFWKKPLDISGAGLLRFSNAFQSHRRVWGKCRF